MNYVNSLKYLQSFERGIGGDGVSMQRLNELCISLGKINYGINFANISGTTSGHVTSLMLDRAIGLAGYTIGHICENYDREGFQCVKINGMQPSNLMVASAVTEISRIIGKNQPPYYKLEEVEFALSLLICRICGCDFVIMEMIPEYHTCFDYVCRPATVTVIPSVYGNDGGLEEIAIGCDAIKKGTHEAVCGVLTPESHNALVSVCVNSGIRLSSAIGGSIEIVSRLPRKTVFNYKNYKELTVRNASQLLVDSAVTSIEVLSRIKHIGINVKIETMREAMEKVGDVDCFELISAYPNIVIHTADGIGEIRVLREAINASGMRCGGKLYMCAVKESMVDINSVFLPGEINDQIDLPQDLSSAICHSCELAIGRVMDGGQKNDTLIFVGSSRNIHDVKMCVKKLLKMPL